MKTYYTSLIALSFFSLSSPLLSAEKNISFPSKLQPPQNTAVANKSIMSNGNSKSVSPKATKSALLKKDNTNRLQNKTRSFAEQNSTKFGAIGKNLNSPSMPNRLNRIKEATENLQEVQNLRRFKERQSMGSLPGSQSGQGFGSEHINPDSSGSPEPESPQGRDCLRGGGNPANCFSNAAGRSSSGSIANGSERPGRATDGVHVPGQGQASSGGAKAPATNDGWVRESDGSSTRNSYTFHQNGDTTSTSETKTSTGFLVETTTTDENGNETHHSAHFTDSEGTPESSANTTIHSDGSSTTYSDEGEDPITVTETDPEGNTISEEEYVVPPAEQSSPEDDGTSGTDGCVWVPVQGCTKRRSSSKEMVGQPNENEDGNTGAGSVAAGVQLDAVVNTGDGSYQSSKHGGSATGFNLRNIMPDSKPEPGTPAGANH